MSDGAEIPAQRADSGDTVNIAAVGTAPAPSTTSTFDRVHTAAGDAADKVTEFATGAADKVGTLATVTADRVSDAVDKAVDASGRIASQVADRIRNSAELPAERGSTTIANEVVEKIAGIAAREVPGVYDLGGDVARVFSAVKERIGLGEADADRGISVRLEGAKAAVKVVLCIEYGFVVYSVTEKVRAKVINAIENLLGLDVTAVDIVVDDVHVPDDHAPVG